MNKILKITLLSFGLLVITITILSVTKTYIDRNNIVDKTTNLSFSQKINSIKINQKMGVDVVRGNQFSLVSHANKKFQPMVSQKDGQLIINNNNYEQTNWGILSGIGLKNNEKLTLTVPENVDIGSLEINASDNVNLQDTDIESIIVNNSAGKIHLANLNTENTILNNGSGIVDLFDVTASKISIKNTAGEIILKKSRIQDLDINIDSGMINASDTQIDKKNIKLGSGKSNI